MLQFIHDQLVQYFVLLPAPGRAALVIAGYGYCAVVAFGELPHALVGSADPQFYAAHRAVRVVCDVVVLQTVAGRNRQSLEPCYFVDAAIVGVITRLADYVTPRHSGDVGRLCHYWGCGNAHLVGGNFCRLGGRDSAVSAV